ncbi:MAG TPA: energy-coupling factor transporter ATPase [Spirochaetales bacterium]|nr:energy-coupling factor transporter ATPase [Spirochaetales bacterium]HPS15265.1 energy-coupling factor transporter ATPase [Spirochaetales bacterium]
MLKTLSPALIALENVSFTYPDAPSPAIKNISLKIYKGDYVAIVGNNGSGKSTLVRLFNGLRLPNEGTVLVDGLDPSLRANLYRVRQRVALVFQSPVDQIVSSCAEEDVAFGPANLSLPLPEIERRVSKALAIVGLENERSRPTRALSGGQQQKLAIAGALAMEPSCIVFDEATSMLDPASKANVLDLMDTLTASGITIVHVTHDMDDAARSGRIIALDHGELVFDGSPETFFAQAEPGAEPGVGTGTEPGVGSATTPAQALGLGVPKAAEAAELFGLETRINETPESLAQRLSALQVTVAYTDGGHTESGNLYPEITQGSAFEYKGVTFSYLSGTANEVRALSDLDLRLPAGARIAFVGATGSGKSTALQLLDALLIPSQGEVVSQGHATTDPKADLKAIRMSAPLAIQRPESALFEVHAADDVAFGPRNQGLSGKALVERVTKWMNIVGLPYASYRDRLSRGLSGGEKRKLGLAGVLAMESEAVLLDEPTSNLDPASQKSIFDIVKGLSSDNKTIVFATHSMEEAAQAQFVAVFHEGRLVAFGPPGDIFYNRYSPSWGIGLPYAVRLAKALSKAGIAIRGTPLNLEDLKTALIDQARQGLSLRPLQDLVCKEGELEEGELEEGEL